MVLSTSDDGGYKGAEKADFNWDICILCLRQKLYGRAREGETFGKRNGIR